MVKKEIKKDTAMIGYILGIMSIVMAFLTPLAGLVFGIIGYVQSKKKKDDLSMKAKKYNTIGIVLSIIFILVGIVFYIYALINGLDGFSNFPIQ